MNANDDGTTQGPPSPPEPPPAPEPCQPAKEAGDEHLMTTRDPVPPSEPPSAQEPSTSAEAGESGGPRQLSRGWRRASRALLVALGLLALVVVPPNLLNAIQRDKQKRTMGYLRTIATAMESYSIDNMQYVLINGRDKEASDALAFYLEPTYVKHLPRLDAWGHYFKVELDHSAQEYTLTSFGRDGLPDDPADPPASPGGGTTSFINDIVFYTGSFCRYPDGTQR